MMMLQKCGKRFWRKSHLDKWDFYRPKLNWKFFSKNQEYIQKWIKAPVVPSKFFLFNLLNITYLLRQEQSQLLTKLTKTSLQLSQHNSFL